MKEKISDSMTWPDFRTFLSVAAILLTIGMLYQLLMTVAQDIKEIKPQVNQIKTDLSVLTARFNDSQDLLNKTNHAMSSPSARLTVDVPPIPTPVPTPEQTIANVVGHLK